jgi:hypothetical protein
MVVRAHARGRRRHVNIHHPARACNGQLRARATGGLLSHYLTFALGSSLYGLCRRFHGHCSGRQAFSRDLAQRQSAALSNGEQFIVHRGFDVDDNSTAVSESHGHIVGTLCAIVNHHDRPKEILCGDGASGV